jgi:CO/xanthine dehydrogenase FAD-binding subunit
VPHRVDVSHLVGTPTDEASLDAVSDLLSDLDPPGDIEVSGTYRRRVAVTLARRALSDARDHARGVA